MEELNAAEISTRATPSKTEEEKAPSYKLPDMAAAAGLSAKSRGDSDFAPAARRHS